MLINLYTKHILSNVLFSCTVIFGRLFVKRFALCRMLLSVLSVCPFCNVGVLWPNCWMEQDKKNWYGGRPSALLTLC